MDTKFIMIDELVRNSHIELSFITLLEDEGLMETFETEGQRYIYEYQLHDLEKYANLYYDLSINIEGIDVIHNLMKKIHEMENELRELRQFHKYQNTTFLDE